MRICASSHFCKYMFTLYNLHGKNGENLEKSSVHKISP